MEKYLQEIVDAYHSGAENNEEISLRRLANEFDITLMKARKLLITAGAYHSDLSDYINQLKEEGKSVEEIMQLTRLSRSSVHLIYLIREQSIIQTKQVHMRKDAVYTDSGKML